MVWTQPNSRPHVALIVETSVFYGRAILKGIARYLDTRRRWSVFLDERELDSPSPEWILDWNGDGAICRSTTLALAERLRSRGLAVVDLNDRYGDLGLPPIASDMGSVGRMAAEYMRARGFERIAYCGFEGEAWCDARLEGLRATAPSPTTFSDLQGAASGSTLGQKSSAVTYVGEIGSPSQRCPLCMIVVSNQRG